MKVNDQILSIPKAELTLRRWEGAPPSNTFGGKALIDFAGRPLFAELCVYELLRLSGWESRWVETYGAPAMRPNLFTAWADDRLGMQQHNPIREPWVKDTLERIAAANLSSYAGCWDVLGWKGTDLLFAELKRRKQDRVRSTQQRWVDAALQAGLGPENFLLVEWDFAE